MCFDISGTAIMENSRTTMDIFLDFERYILAWNHVYEICARTFVGGLQIPSSSTIFRLDLTCN